MLELSIREVEKLISMLNWIQEATLSTEDERNMINNLVEKLKIIKKTSSSKRVRVSIKE